MLARGTRGLGMVFPPDQELSSSVRAGPMVETTKYSVWRPKRHTRATSHLVGRPCYLYLQNEVLSGFHFFHRRAPPRST